jgi:phytoene desaturase
LPEFCSRFSRSSNTSTASSIRSADAARSRKHSRASPNASASRFHLDEPVEELLIENKRACRCAEPAGYLPCRFCGRERRLRTRDVAARAGCESPPLDREEHRAEEILLLDVHDVSRHRRALRSAASQHLRREDYERNLDEIERQHVLSRDPSFYVQNASVTDSTLAPEGMSTLYVLAPVTHQHPNVDWAQEKERFRALMLKQIEKAGFTDVESRIRFERIVTPQQWDEQYEIHLGATFNLSHTLDQLLHLRPRNRFEDVPGVYLVGGGTHPGSGLPVIFESARITSRLMCEDLGITPPIAAATADKLGNALEALT